MRRRHADHPVRPPGDWGYGSSTSFIGQLAEALEELAHGFVGAFPAGKLALPKAFRDVRFLLTREMTREPGAVPGGVDRAWLVQRAAIMDTWATLAAAA